MGAGDAAIVDLRTAIRLEPKFLPASLTAGTILESQGRFQEAVKIYDEALSGTAPESADPLRSALTEARTNLLAKHPR
jgi:tetratricopeptide (TPR) repeat protein